MPQDIGSLQQDWDGLGQLDPMWAILTEPKKRDNWDQQAFFQTGKAEIDALLRDTSVLGLPSCRDSALDFGCGIGRLSQALAAHFCTVDGIDIAPSMVRLGEELNQFPERVHYHVNSRDDLQGFEDHSFDLVLSLITLQHIPHEFSRRYMAEFVRLLKPGGVCVFQIPWRRRNPLMRVVPRRLLDGVFKMRNPGVPRARMFGTSPESVRAVVQAAGGRVVKSVPDTRAGANWASFLYFVTVDAPSV